MDDTEYRAPHYRGVRPSQAAYEAWLAKKAASTHVDKAEEAKRLRAAAEQVEAEIAAEAAEKEAKAKRDAFVAQVKAEKTLVEIGAIMLGDIAKLIAGESSHVAAQIAYADHRQGLSELARKYGYKLVLVGDRTKAALVQR